MKKKFTVILFGIVSFCFGQINSGKITYKKLTNPIDLSKVDITIKDQLIKTSKDSEKIEYSLVFKKNEAYFYANNILEENNSFNAYVAISGGKLKLYQNKDTNECREFVDSKRAGKNIVNRKILYKWILTNETKTIDGYKCYKATSPYFKEDGSISENQSLRYTAWYCPEIPIKFGPLGFGDLPGLILELQTKTSTFTASKISLNLKEEEEEEVFIDRLTSPKAISEEQYRQMVMGTFNRSQLEAIEESKSKK